MMRQVKLPLARAVARHIPVAALLCWASTAEATPQFAREHRVDCAHCHSAPPRLNQRGEDFVAAGYRLPLESSQSRATVPLAVWNTFDVEHRPAANLTKAFPSRVELISGGVIPRTRLSYFLELRALSQQIGAGNRLLNRSGRFEDAFVNAPFGPERRITLTAGQFRALNQVDVSRRLSISEPLAFSAGLGAAEPALSRRLTDLRSFAPSGRQPALRLAYQTPGRRGAADGWYSAVTLPLTGELTLPVTDGASFELEGRPKGAFGESFYRRGLSTIGGHAFLGDRRRLANVLVVRQIGERVGLVAALGLDHVASVTRTRYSFAAEYTVNAFLVSGLRVDHRTSTGRDPAVHLFGNVHVPFGAAAFRQAVRLQIEQRVQSGNHGTLVGLSHVF
jgi:hypothetical protein